MKRLYTLLFLFGAAFFFTSCSKSINEPVYIDETAWLSQDRAIVVASDFSCPFFVLETRNGYSVMRSWGGGTPFQGSILYGNFDRYGVSTYYNRSERMLVQADTRDMWLSYFQAMEMAEWECTTY